MNETDFKSLISENILVLDGAMGTMIQRLRLSESDFRGSRFAQHNRNLAGCYDILCLTRPEDIKIIHRAYIEAGADIITTNSFNANAISLEGYLLHRDRDLIREINRSAAAIAREVADEASRRVLVAGSVGPTCRLPDASDPLSVASNYDALFDAYIIQIQGLIEGGADILLFETVFDTLNLKAGLDAATSVMHRLGKNLPIMVSATLSERPGRILFGQTLEVFAATVKDYPHVVSIGLNCSFGASQMLPDLRTLALISSCCISAHPNAGLADDSGNYPETPELFAEHMEPLIREGIVNIAGGCCGTTPAHIKSLSALIASRTLTKPNL
ncbi:MAG: homocysteine S-methyltransferase family protein [Muribaculum sp.]|nr:homocysteine S-methyltransferase family protein [Muribaculum sp.]